MVRLHVYIRNTLTATAEELHGQAQRLVELFQSGGPMPLPSGPPPDVIVYHDGEEGLAAKPFAERPSGKALMEAARPNDYFMTPDLNHVAADCRSMLQFLKTLPCQHVYFASEGRNVGIAECAVFARLEDAIGRERAGLMVAARKRIGFQPNGRVPYGMHVRGPKGGRRLEPSKVERKMIARLAELAGREEPYSTPKMIAAYMNAHGWKFRGRRWTPSTVKAALADAAGLTLQSHPKPNTLPQPADSEKQHASEPTIGTGGQDHGRTGEAVQPGRSQIQAAGGEEQQGPGPGLR